MNFIAWPEIEAFHHIRKFLRVDPTDWWRAKEQLHGTSTVVYKAKVKLHGTNSAVQLHEKGEIVCQSRESIITPEKDNAGFARWVMSHKDKWSCAIDKAYIAGHDGWIIYGEWCGPGIQKNVAVSQVPTKFFAVFAARPIQRSDALIIEPSELQDLVKGVPGVYVLPWYTYPAMGTANALAVVSVNWRNTDEQLTEDTQWINQWVAAVEANDPWVEATFGVKGTGEGLVFYPTSTPHLGYEMFQNLVFKAKGEKHKNIATAKPAQVSAEAAASIDAFVAMVLTEARLEQGAGKIASLTGSQLATCEKCGTQNTKGDTCVACMTGSTPIPVVGGSYDMKLTGKFVAWILGDVEKETQDELAASNLTFKQVQKAIGDKARAWFLEKAKQ